MSQALDITIERSHSGTPTYIKFDYNKYAGLLHSFFLQNDIDIPLIPNAATKKAIKEATGNKKLKQYTSVSAMMADLNA